MKKSLSQAIALATLMGGAVAAHAVDVNPAGIGGALVYPLYTVEEGNTSLVSVVNTTGNYKAVKVRFVEAKNSAEVLDFHLYLSPWDTWSGTIVPTATGAKLVSNDKSCVAGITANDGTFPKDGLAFRTEQITLDENRLIGAPSHKSSNAEKAARVRVGHFEAIEMGEIDNGIVPASTVGGTLPGKSLRSAILHTNGVPGGCDLVTQWWQKDLGMTGSAQDRVNKLGGAATGDATITVPTGGLYGTGGIVNVKEGWAASYDAVALVNSLTDAKDPLKADGTKFYTQPQHPRPGSIYPHLGTATFNADQATAAADTVMAATSHMVATTNPVDMSHVVPSDARLQAVTNALNVKSVYNDYYVDPALDAGTELVVTFPTKRFYTFEAVDADSALRYIYTAGNYGVYTNNVGPTVGGANPDPEGAGWAIGVAQADNGAYLKSPFETRWNTETKTASVAFDSPTLYGKDEQSITATDGFISPRPLVTGTIPLNYEANVISLNNSNALGAKNLVAVNVDTPFMEGWLKVVRAAGAPTTQVPAVGFGIITTKNGVSADGALRNFAQTFKHKTSPR